MSKTINFQEYLGNKNIEDLEEILDKLDFENPFVVKSLFKSLIISYIQNTKKISDSLTTVANAATNLTEHVIELEKGE
jgi:hypothetical protein